MKLTTRSRYGVRLIVDIAQNGQTKPVPIKDIAERQGVSVKYLEKLVRELKRAGYVTSRRGPHGGHQLARPMDAITMDQIVLALEGDMELVDCLGGNGGCPRRSFCPTRVIWVEAARAVRERLGSLTLGELVRLAEAGAPPAGP
ncbi:RrF2 family transcriptional regulator [Desulfolutivibrio sulfoxidireducens]|uniref:RrF2 family transcriptional regulator n=1 Tax=Desulfolutivibrio sulfoxidireducens TaxID=2773299 RepID=UPI00159DF49E|nr:RrF2 family transcriptional regulator [Desulfolutivibrio sulfoxidireducens]QLA17672.1 Rrf2 family transcriptional regulator [Desulfolutivibrio sulfoxidireducens]QLA21241.1 Rrf2 family transcriptional regulator [Desulfolutivibrio sulfoxidireducens]